MADTLFLLHPSSALHDTGWGHPEHQGRLRALASTVGRDMLALHGRAEQAEPDEATVEDLLRVHTDGHVERVREAVDRAAELEDEGRRGRSAGRGRERAGPAGLERPDAPEPGEVSSRPGPGDDPDAPSGPGAAIVELDPDTRVSGGSWNAALGSVGAALTAVGAVAEGRYRNAFAATRPPGHHATPDRAMGFCLFNHVAVAARWLQDRGHARRVLIVDWDVHHGNGTQDIFWEDDSVFFLSLHQFPHWPGTGRESERGGGPGEGYTRNVEMRPGTPRATYLQRYEAALDEVLGRFRPDFVLVSSGFDCLAGDPLGGQLLEPLDLHRMTGLLVERAEEACGGRVVACLEGGYDPRRTGMGAVAVIRALAGVEAPGQAGRPL